ncbi:MAG: hypothetical protein ACR2PQ_01795 [Myxococcota bacterium]
MLELVRPIDTDTLQRMLRYGLTTAIQRVHLRPGCRPLAEGLGTPREISFRQLTREDIDAVAGHFLAAAQVSERVRDGAMDAAREIFLFMELPGGGLAEATLEPCDHGIAITIELYALLPEAERASL